MADYTLPQGRELDVMWAKAIGLKVIAMDWPCAYNPETGDYEAETLFWRGASPADASFTERGPVTLEPSVKWPQEQRGHYGELFIEGIEAVKFYSSSITAAWLVKAEMIKRGYWWEIATKHGSIQAILRQGDAIKSVRIEIGNNEADEARCIVSAALDALHNAGEV